MLDLVQRTPWDQLIGYFARGNPPIIVQILLLNTAVFVWFAWRRMRKAQPLRKETASTVQSLLLALNMVAVFEQSIFQIIHRVF